MKTKAKDSKERSKEISLNYKMLPLIINFLNKEGEAKEYVLKTNSDNTKLWLIKKDY